MPSTHSKEDKISDLPPTFDDSNLAEVQLCDKDFEHAWKLHELRFEYAWRYFELHAKQRMTMFSFFVIFTGFLITGCVDLLIKPKYDILLYASLFGVLITLVFILLDRRNQELVYVGEDVLLDLENNSIFKAYTGTPEDQTWLPFLVGGRTNDTISRDLGIFRRQESERKSWHAHSIWMPGAQYLIIAIYLVFAYHACHATD